MIQVNDELTLDENELELTAVRASGPGGQHVNKVSSAIQLRFDVAASSLPPPVRQALIERLGGDQVLVIKARSHRSQERNRRDAIARLVALIQAAATPQAPRIPTRPSRAAKARRVDEKKRKSQIKAARRKPIDD